MTEPQSAPPAEFKVGDRVSALDALEHGDRVEGRYLGPSKTEPGFSVIDREDGKGWIARVEGEPYDCQDAWHVATGSLRRASPTPAPVEYWWECPEDEELPAELPPGFRDGYGLNQTHDIVRLERTATGDPRYVCALGMHCCWVPPDRLPWHKIPKSLPKQAERIPVNGPALCGDCGLPIENMLEACSRIRTRADGNAELVPGVFHSHGRCPVDAQPADPYGIPRATCVGAHDFDLFHTCRECGVTEMAIAAAKAKRDTTGPYAPKGGLGDARIAAYMSGADETYMKSGRSLRISAARPPRGEREGAGHPASFPEGAHHDAEELYTS